MSLSPKAKRKKEMTRKKALNKDVRFMRSRGARKDTTLNNFTDTFNHLWDRSRPIIVEMERKIKRRPLKLLVGTEIEAAVEGLFAEESCG